MQLTKTNDMGRTVGFSLLELVIVAGVIAVATAMAVPVIVTARNTYQLRTATVDLASLMQKARIYCVQNNRATAVQTSTATAGLVFLDAGAVGAAGNPNRSWPQVQLPTNITQTNAGAPAIPAATLGFASAQAPPASFDGRGLPCAVNAGGVCSNWSTANNAAIGYVYYIRQVSNGTRWAAVSVTPGGQVKSWSYNGAAWVNR